MLHSDQNKVVIFDLGNVVLNWDVDGILDSLDLATEERSLLRQELFAHQHWLDLDHGKESEASVIAKICNRSPLTHESVEAALLAAKNSLVPIAETVSLMQEISESQIQMYCLSNMSREMYSHISSLEFFDLFSGIVISGIEGCMKPGEEIFNLIINRFELNPADTLFIDDSLPNVLTAQRLGVNALHFKRSQNCYTKIRQQLF
jgi:putative hydrolase of the HAD superfamily